MKISFINYANTKQTAKTLSFGKLGLDEQSFIDCGRMSEIRLYKEQAKEHKRFIDALDKVGIDLSVRAGKFSKWDDAIITVEDRDSGRYAYNASHVETTNELSGKPTYTKEETVKRNFKKLICEGLDAAKMKFIHSCN